jgi:hypothetical protein
MARQGRTWLFGDVRGITLSLRYSRITSTPENALTAGAPVPCEALIWKQC